MDLKWNPFNDRVLATSADDGTIKIWVIPEDGLKDSDLTPIRVISHHKKRVYNLEWHPSAENILASASADHTVGVFDIGAASDKEVLVSKSEPHEDFVSQVVWDYEGERFFTFGKEQILRCFEARSGKLLQQASNAAHHQKRGIRIASMGKSNLIVTTGFSALNAPELKIWEMDNLDRCIITHPCGEGSGCLFPFFDPDTNVLYVAARGEVTIRYFELAHCEESDWKLYDLYIFNSQTSQKALCCMPKRGVEYMECEIMRMYKLLNSTAMVEPVSFFVPRRAEGFQEDLYPDTVGVEPALSAKDWISGTKSGPPLVPIQDIPKETSRDAPEGFNASNASSGSELDSLKEKYESELNGLRSELKAAQSVISEKDDQISSLTSQLESVKSEIEALRGQVQSLQQGGAAENSTIEQSATGGDEVAPIEDA